MPEPLTLVNTVGWGISILGWVISPIISKLVSKGWSYLQDVTGSSANNNRLQNLEKKVENLMLMLEAAQVSPDGKKKLERWVKELKSAFYSAEDILDAIDYHHLKCKALFHHQSVNTTKQKAKPKKDLNVPNESKKELRETLKKIEDLIDEGQKLLALVHLTTSSDNIKSSPNRTKLSLSKNIQNTSEPPKVFGREEDTKKIISMLHDTPADGHFVIGIHGIAGSGKTTVAQYVCDREKKSEDHYFELIMWIHVTKNFSVHTIYNEMLEIVLVKDKFKKQKDKFSNLDMLQSELKGKRFLLVLDDVWYSEIVDKLLSPLKEADKGSRVLVTSQTAEAAERLGAKNPVSISDMDEEEFFKMFMHYALDESPVRDQDKGKFETVGREISRLLWKTKSPLAARTVAGQLRIKTRRAEDIGFWKDTLNRKGDLLNDTMGALWWSYHQLDEHVRQCFAYCSMFPRRHELDRDELVKMWRAQGFVDTSKTTSDMEVAAHECFEVLLSTSFIQLKRNIADREYYTVHDLLYDLAESVAGSDCFRIEGDMVNPQIPQGVRHLFIDSKNIGEFIEQIVKQDTLRTLVMSDSLHNEELTTEDFKRILKHLKKLRFVSVNLEEALDGNVIPECIGDLKHLRYLGLSCETESIDLPPAFAKLYHLQEFCIGCPVRCLDSSHLADLENLLHIACDSSMSIPDIGRMPWLQTLGIFTVKKEKGYEITQLENLNNIHGKLEIAGLGNIESKEDARRANLSNKLHVSWLEFDWETDENEETGSENEETGSSSRKKQKTAAHNQQEVTPKPEEILEALHPPPLLETLWIKNYNGSTFPSWLSGEEDGKLIEHLKYLCFLNCHGSSSELKFSKPHPKLHILYIETCSWKTLPDNIKEQLASLEYLRIHDCQNMQSLPELPSSLKKLQITECENITALPELPPSLEQLHCSSKALLDSYPDQEVIKRTKVDHWIQM